MKVLESETSGMTSRLGDSRLSDHTGDGAASSPPLAASLNHFYGRVRQSWGAWHDAVGLSYLKDNSCNGVKVAGSGT